MTTMTKSLHTVTAVLNVAAYLDSQNRYKYLDANVLLRDALAILGYAYADYAMNDDPTIAKLVAGCSKLLARG